VGWFVEKVNLTKLFSEVLKKHTTDDAEKRFIVGTALTTPDIDRTPPEMPRPWLFARVVTLSLVGFIAFYIGALVFQNAVFLPGLILFGSIIAPISLLIFFWEINILQNISIYKLTIFMIKGSIVALLCAVLLFAVLKGHSPIFTGFVEETAKVASLLLLVDHRNYKFTINGMLIGAAIGAGFAAFETSGYILISALEDGIPTMLQTIFWRTILTPGGHIAWAALTGAILIMIKGERIFRITMLFDPRFVGMYLTVIVLHALWDTESIHFWIYRIPVVLMLLTVISWTILFMLMKSGFKQVVRVQSHKETT
jgi:RsiW-degrading membrane proteinase PrsW (M82 family)